MGFPRYRRSSQRGSPRGISGSRSSPFRRNTFRRFDSHYSRANYRTPWH